jgi:hypothetical protein
MSEQQESPAQNVAGALRKARIYIEYALTLPDSDITGHGLEALNAVDRALSCGSLQASPTQDAAVSELSEKIAAKMAEPALVRLAENLPQLNELRYLSVIKQRPCAVSDWYVLLPSGKEIILSAQDWEAASRSPAECCRQTRNQALEEAAQIAGNGCLVPPDGGSPTEAESEMCESIASCIRLRKLVGAEKIFDQKSAPGVTAAQNTAEGLLSSDAAGAGAETARLLIMLRDNRYIGQEAMREAAAAEIEQLRADIEKLKDPVVVHMGMLRGGIAKISLENVKHLYPEVQQAFALVEGAEKRWLAVHDLVHKAREMVRLQINPEDRPDQLFQTLQDALYAIRGREVSNG